MNKLLAKRPKQFSEHVYLQLTGNLPEPNINRKQALKKIQSMFIVTNHQ